MADRFTYGQEQAEKNLRYWQGLSGKMRKPSYMASPEERAAYTAQEVRAGNAPEYELPEDYGGMPQGTTRRAIRAREAWGQQQAYIAGLAEQQAKMEMEQKRFNLQLDQEKRMQGQYQLELDAALKRSARENRIQDEARAIQDSIIGGKYLGDQDGVPQFSQPIRPDDDDAVDRLREIARNRLGMENPAALAMWKDLYEDAQKYQEAKAESAIETRDKNLSFIVDQQKEASSLGVDVSPYFTQDEQTGEVTAVDQIGLSEAIGKAKKEDIERKKQEIVGSKLDEESRKQAVSIIGQIEDTDKLIREANFKAQRETSKKIIDEYLSQSEFLRSERALLEQRFNSIKTEQEQPQEKAQPAKTQSQQAEPQKAKTLQEKQQIIMNFAEKITELKSKLDSVIENAGPEENRNSFQNQNITNITNELTEAQSEYNIIAKDWNRDQAALNWANANSNDPRAKKIKDKLGVQ
jgi:hypothetical protein